MKVCRTYPRLRSTDNLLTSTLNFNWNKSIRVYSHVLMCTFPYFNFPDSFISSLYVSTSFVKVFFFFSLNAKLNSFTTRFRSLLELRAFQSAFYGIVSSSSFKRGMRMGLNWFNITHFCGSRLKIGLETVFNW